MAEILELTPLSYIVVLGLSLTNFAMGLLDPTIPLYLLSIGVSYSGVGVIASARFLVVAIASLPLALFASRIGISRILYASGISAIVSALILFYGHGAGSVYWFYFVAGINEASISGPGAAILAENHGSKRVTAFALFSATWMIPPAIGAAVSTIWFSGNQKEDAATYASIFPIVFYVMVIGGILFIIILLFTTKSGHTTNVETDKRLPVVDQARILFAPIIVIPLLLLTLSQFLGGAGAGATIPFLSPYLNSLDATPGEISLLVMIMNLSMGVATQLSAPLAKRFGDIQIYVITTILSVATLLGIAFTNNLGLASTLYILRGTFANMSAPIGQARMIAYIEASVRATGSAFTSTCRWIGWTMFSPISGKIIGTYGYETSFVFTSIIYIISLLLFVYVIKSKPDLEMLAGQHVFIDHPAVSRVNLP